MPKIVVALVWLVAHSVNAQAPIQDRADEASSIEGARLAARIARESTARAEQRLREADRVLSIATDHHKKVQTELDAARSEQASAVRSLDNARKADADANAALDRALKK